MRLQSLAAVTAALLAVLFTAGQASAQTAINARNDTYAKDHPNQFKSWEGTKASDKREDALADDPNLVILWAGYPFAKDYNKPRGHYYTVTDVRETLRTAAPKTAEDGPLPMACWSCKSPDVARVIAAQGEEAYFKGMWARGGPEIVNQLGCADCHDTNSAEYKEGKVGKPALKMSRPYASRAMDAIKTPFDKANRGQKQAMVCGQCHVEYYFEPANKFVKFPWDDGYTVAQMEAYYDKINFVDWTNSISKTPALKAQHPEYETWILGVHGKNGVTCADCHMPKMKDAKGVEYTSHTIVRAPQEQFDKICVKCHDEQRKDTLPKIVADRKKQVTELKLRVEKQLVDAHFEAKAALDNGVSEADMAPIHKDIRHAQWRWDFAIASHGVHAHAADVALSILGSALDKAADARIKLARVLAAKNITVAIPDVSTKEKAQAAVGLDMAKLKSEKADFLKTVVPTWDEQARKNGLIP